MKLVPVFFILYYMTRKELQNKKTYIYNSINKIVSTYDTIETQEQFSTFFNMCNNLNEYCNFLERKLEIKTIFGKLFKNKQYILYKDFNEFHKYITEQLQEMIDSYNDVISEIQKKQEQQQELEDRMRLEYMIKQKISDEYNKMIINKTNPIGFNNIYESLNKKRKKKKTKSKL